MIVHTCLLGSARDYRRGRRTSQVSTRRALAALAGTMVLDEFADE